MPTGDTQAGHQGRPQPQEPTPVRLPPPLPLLASWQGSHLGRTSRGAVRGEMQGRVPLPPAQLGQAGSSRHEHVGPRTTRLPPPSAAPPHSCLMAPCSSPSKGSLHPPMHARKHASRHAWVSIQPDAQPPCRRTTVRIHFGRAGSSTPAPSVAGGVARKPLSRPSEAPRVGVKGARELGAGRAPRRPVQIRGAPAGAPSLPSSAPPTGVLLLVSLLATLVRLAATWEIRPTGGSQRPFSGRREGCDEGTSRAPTRE